jgi:hypothetical protein
LQAKASAVRPSRKRAERWATIPTWGYVRLSL